MTGMGHQILKQGTRKFDWYACSLRLRLSRLFPFVRGIRQPFSVKRGVAEEWKEAVSKAEQPCRKGAMHLASLEIVEVKDQTLLRMLSL